MTVPYRYRWRLSAYFPRCREYLDWCLATSRPLPWDVLQMPDTSLALISLRRPLLHHWNLLSDPRTVRLRAEPLITFSPTWLASPRISEFPFSHIIGIAL